jgi:hypothetical protein
MSRPGTVILSFLRVPAVRRLSLPGAGGCPCGDDDDLRGGEAMNAVTTTAWTYLAYLGICVGITVWVARTLRKHGRTFLTDGRDDRKELSDSLSHLLVVGFYLVNLGVICFAMKIQGSAADLRAALELLSTKVGTILVVLGVMHFLILAVFGSARKGQDRPRRNDEPAAPIFPGHAAHELAARRGTT